MVSLISLPFNAGDMTVEPKDKSLPPTPVHFRCAFYVLLTYSVSIMKSDEVYVSIISLGLPRIALIILIYISTHSVCVQHTNSTVMVSKQMFYLGFTLGWEILQDGLLKHCS